MVSFTTRPFYRPGTHCIGGWVWNLPGLVRPVASRHLCVECESFVRNCLRERISYMYLINRIKGEGNIKIDLQEIVIQPYCTELIPKQPTRTKPMELHAKLTNIPYCLITG
jgi:hypothetical protein